jgi:hypothetical protein
VLPTGQSCVENIFKEEPLSRRSLHYAALCKKNISKRGPQISPLRCAPVEMTKERTVLPGTVVVEQESSFITLGRPKAHDFSGRDDRGRLAPPEE